MKLATLRDGTRDGRLVLVSRDLTRYTDAAFLVPTLQAALDDWPRIAPHLTALAEVSSTARFPRTVSRARCTLAPAARLSVDRRFGLCEPCRACAQSPGRPAVSFWNDPLIYQGGSDSFLDRAILVRRRSLGYRP